MTALKIEGLTKRYPAFTLDRVGFTVEEGRVCGLVGRNGAGKSTTLKGILGLIQTEGEVELCGVSLRERELAAKRLIGYVGGGFRFYPNQKVGVLARAASAFYPDWSETAFSRLAEEFALDRNKKISQLSEGMKVKFSVALALSHGAKLLVMDEPTSGLDPVSREELCDTLLRLVKEEGITVLFSTHITSDLMRIADDVVYLSHGKVLADETLQGLLGRFSLAHFSKRPQCDGALGLKEVKDGFEALLSRGAACDEATLSEPTIDDIIIHLEYEGRAI